jgi:FAD/FMN-containing dehydrogenase
MKPEAMEPWAEFLARTHACDEDVFTLVKATSGGSISAEHGIGLLKKDFLGYSRTTRSSFR